jgi:hypothetical protein
MLPSPLDSWLAALAAMEPFGALGLLAGIASGLMPRRNAILLASALCSALFCVHFLRLGSGTGAAMCLISVIQSLAAAGAHHGRRPPWFAGLFAGSSALAVALTLATWAGWSSALAGAGSLLATAARLQTDVRRMRLVLVACSLCWMGHNLILGSTAGLASDLFTLTSLGLGLWLDRRALASRAA